MSSTSSLSSMSESISSSGDASSPRPIEGVQFPQSSSNATLLNEGSSESPSIDISKVGRSNDEQMPDHDIVSETAEKVSITSLLSPPEDYQEAVISKRWDHSDPNFFVQSTNTAGSIQDYYQLKLQEIRHEASSTYGQHSSHAVGPSIVTTAANMQVNIPRSTDKESRALPLPSRTHIAFNPAMPWIAEDVPQRSSPQLYAHPCLPSDNIALLPRPALPPVRSSRTRQPHTSHAVPHSNFDFTMEKRDFIRFHRADLKFDWPGIQKLFHVQWPESQALRQMTHSINAMNESLIDANPERIIANNYSWISTKWKQVAWRSFLRKKLEREIGQWHLILLCFPNTNAGLSIRKFS